MADYSGSERAFCCFLYHETHSAITVQRKFQAEHDKDPPSRATIIKWHAKFSKTGCVVHRQPGQGRPAMSEDIVAIIRDAFLRDPLISLNRLSRELGLPLTTVHKVLRKKKEGSFKPTKKKELSTLDVKKSSDSVKIDQKID